MPSCSVCVGRHQVCHGSPPCGGGGKYQEDKTGTGPVSVKPFTQNLTSYCARKIARATNLPRSIPKSPRRSCSIAKSSPTKFWPTDNELSSGLFVDGLDFRHVQSLLRHKRAGRDHRIDARAARQDRQSAADAGCLSRLSRADRAQRTRWRTRINAGALGHARTAAVRWHRSPTSAIPRARTGARGSNPKIAASCRLIPFANMPIPSRVRRRPGSHATRIGRLHSLPAFGRPGTAGEAPKPIQLKASTSYSDF